MLSMRQMEICMKVKGPVSDHSQSQAIYAAEKDWEG